MNVVEVQHGGVTVTGNVRVTSVQVQSLNIQPEAKPQPVYTRGQFFEETGEAVHDVTPRLSRSGRGRH